MGGARRLKLDGSIPNQLARAADAAVALERNGFDGGWTAEASHDPFLPLLLAAEHTSRLELGTNIAVAFARNPMIVANVGWDLQMNRPGMSGDSSSWKGWGHVRW
ncbi:LLM class flavin-dependent oxidoreductase, partial [Mycobacterium sp. HOS52]